MNAVAIEEAVARLAEQPFDPKIFPHAFLEAFGNKETTLKWLRAEGKASTNQSDLPGGVLQRNNIHLQVCPEPIHRVSITTISFQLKTTSIHPISCPIQKHPRSTH
jgi:hypothetical protein